MSMIPFEDLFVINIGAVGDLDYGVTGGIKKRVHLAAIDAVGALKFKASEFLEYLPLDKVIAGRAGPRRFYVRKYQGCSSLLQPKMHLVKKYGLERFYELEKELEVDCITLKQLLETHQWPRVDFLKTDAEGMDLEIIQGLETKFLAEALVIQAELRFEPFYESEPYFHEALTSLHENGFELMALRPEIWKPKTHFQRFHRDGQNTWADCFFVRKIGCFSNGCARNLKQTIARQIAICAMVGFRSYGEHLLESNIQLFSNDDRAFLLSVVQPIALEQSLKAGRKQRLKRILKHVRALIWGRKAASLSSQDFELFHVVR